MWDFVNCDKLQMQYFDDVEKKKNDNTKMLDDNNLQKV